MKKVLAFLLTAMLAVTALTATAAPSPEKSSGVIVSVSAKDTAGKSYNVEVKPSTVDQSVYNDAFAAFKQENGSDFKIVDQKKLEGNISAGSPLTVELSVPGVKATSKVYILLKKSNGEIVKLDATAGTGKVTATFTELGEFVLITDAQTDADIIEAAKDDTKSPQTSDNATPVMVALFAVAAVLGVVSVKKIRTAA